MNKYIFVCSHLCDNSFNTLKKYKGFDHRKAKFSTWLKVVVSNLCLDEIRSVRGRERLPSVIERMTEDEKKIYKLYYWKGFNETQIAEHLINIDENRVIVLLGGINEVLEGRRNGRTKFRFRKTVPLNENIVSSNDAPNLGIEKSEIINFLNESLKEFSARERVIVKLKYWNDWTAKEIASFVKLPQRKIYTVLDKVLFSLREKAVKKKLL